MNCITALNNAINVLSKAYKGSDKEVFNMFRSTGNYYYKNEEWGYFFDLFDEIREYAEFTNDNRIEFLVKGHLAECKNMLQLEM